MRHSTRRELSKLRELVHFLLAGETCAFCNKPISPKADTWTEHGNATGPVFDDSVTVHHVDGNHYNNTHDNKSLCHTKCHKAFHRAQANKERALRRRLKEDKQ